MKSYLKPEFHYITLKVEERYAAGSSICTITGSCPGHVGTCDFTYNGSTYTANLLP